MDPNTQNVLISASAGLVGAVLGGLFTMWANIRANKKQLEMQTIQLRSQNELKARELMFNSYQKKSEEFNEEIKELGRQMAQLSMARYIPTVDESDYHKALLGFVGTMKMLTDPFINKIGEIDNEFKDAGLYEKYESQIDFVKQHLASAQAINDPLEVQGSFQNISKALTYLVGMQNSLVEHKKMELFSDFLPKKELVKGV